MYRFETWDDFMSNSNPSEIKHPILDRQPPSSLYATESRVLALSKGALGHVFELDYKGSVTLVEDLEGLGVETVVPGSANRLGAITEAGDAYMINRRSLEPELVEMEGVRCIGVGSKHEVVVTEEVVWVRGESTSRTAKHANLRQLWPARYRGRDEGGVCRVSILHRRDGQAYPVCALWSMVHYRRYAFMTKPFE